MEEKIIVIIFSSCPVCGQEAMGQEIGKQNFYLCDLCGTIFWRRSSGKAMILKRGDG